MIGTRSSKVPAVIARWSAAQRFALVSAAVYLSAGLIGFAVTGFNDFATATDERIIVLSVNPLHNIVHLTLGAVYLAGVFHPARARHVNVAIGLGLLAAFIVGVAGGATFINIEGVAEADNWLHLAWGAASVAFGAARDRTVA